MSHFVFFSVQQIILLFHCVVRNNTTEYPETAVLAEIRNQDTKWEKNTITFPQPLENLDGFQ